MVVKEMSKGLLTVSSLRGRLPSPFPKGGYEEAFWGMLVEIARVDSRKSLDIKKWILPLCEIDTAQRKRHFSVWSFRMLLLRVFRVVNQSAAVSLVHQPTGRLELELKPRPGHEILLTAWILHKRIEESLSELRLLLVDLSWLKLPWEASKDRRVYFCEPPPSKWGEKSVELMRRILRNLLGFSIPENGRATIEISCEAELSSTQNGFPLALRLFPGLLGVVDLSMR